MTIGQFTNYLSLHEYSVPSLPSLHQVFASFFFIFSERTSNDAAPDSPVHSHVQFFLQETKDTDTRTADNKVIFLIIFI